MAGINLKISADDQATGVLNGVARSVHEINSAVLQSQAPVFRLKDAFMSLGAAVGLWAVAGYMKDATMMAARYETLGVTMRVVGNNAGYTGVQMAEFETSLRKTGIAAIEARETLTKMAGAHIDMTKSAQLARVAQDAAVIGGINSSEAFERMIQGIQSGNTETLRTIGININLDQTYKKMSVTLNKNVGDLTEVEKVQARTNAVLEKGKDITGAYEAAMGTAGKQMTSMKRYMDDLKVKVGEVFLDALTVATSAVTDGFKGMNKEAEDLAKAKQLDAWGRDALMALAFVADGVQGIIILFRTITEVVTWSGKEIYGWAGVLTNALTGQFANAGTWITWMNKNTEDSGKNIAKLYTGIVSFQDKATEYLKNKDAAKANKSALDEIEKKLMATGAATRAENAAYEKQTAFEKEWMANLRNRISLIKDSIAIMKTAGQAQLEMYSDTYKEKLKENFELYKDGSIAMKDMIKPLLDYNAQIGSVFDQRIALERTGLKQVTDLYDEFKKSITQLGNAKETKQYGITILNEVKDQAKAIIAIEKERYKTQIEAMKQYEGEAFKIIQAKKAELKAVLLQFEEANKSFEEKRRLATGDFSGGFEYLDPNLDALDKRNAMVKKMREDELAYDQISDPARKTEKLKALITAWEAQTAEVTLNGQVVITTAQAFDEVGRERLRLQEKVKTSIEDERVAWEQTWEAVRSKIEEYKQQLLNLDDILRKLTTTITIDLKVNGLEQINKIQSLVGQTTSSAVGNLGGTPSPVLPSPSGGTGMSSNPYDYNQVGDSFYWGDGSYAGPAYENGTGPGGVPQTGLALVHKGEDITPAGQKSGGSIQIGSLSISMPNVTDSTTARQLAKMLVPELRDLNLRFT